jgi:uncharacterized protein (TIRG00374 family)
VRRPGWQFLLGVLLGALLLWLSLRGVDLPRLWDALVHADYWLLAPACVVTLAAFYVRAVRWGVLLRAVKPIPTGSLFSAMMIGYAANNLLPARLGEFVRAWAIGRLERISRSAAFATVVVERVVDVFSLLLFFALMLLVHPFSEKVRRSGWALLAFNLLLLGALIAAERHPDGMARLGEWLARGAPPRFRPRLRGILDNFVGGLHVLRQGPAIAWVALYSLVLYLLAIGAIQVCLAAFDFQVPWYASTLLLVAITLGITVAPTPGYVGAVQVACVWGLSLLGVDRSRAFSYSLFYHVSQFVPVTAVGLWYLARQGLTLRDVAGAAEGEVKASA